MPSVAGILLACASEPEGGSGHAATGGTAGASGTPAGAPGAGSAGAPFAGAGSGAASGTAGAAGVGASGGFSGTGNSGGTAGAGGEAAGAAGQGGAENAGAGGRGGAGDTGGSAGAGSPNGGAGGGSAGNGATGGSAGKGTGGAAPMGCDWENPEGRVVLFDGTSLAAFRNSTTGGAATWRLVGDGTMEVVPMNPSSNIHTAMTFEDACLHLEYLTPMYPANVTGQQRGNSGIYFKRAYEMQVLDTYGQPPAIDGCGAIYGISPPLVVACNMQLVWNTYQIEFKASRWDASGRKTENARFVSATLNGQVVQRNVELNVSSTTAGEPDARGPQPLMLQDHGNPVRFRNIWLKVPRY